MRKLESTVAPGRLNICALSIVLPESCWNICALSSESQLLVRARVRAKSRARAHVCEAGQNLGGTTHASSDALAKEMEIKEWGEKDTYVLVPEQVDELRVGVCAAVGEDGDVELVELRLGAVEARGGGEVGGAAREQGRGGEDGR